MHRSLFTWWTATSGRYHCKWRQSRDLYEQWVGYCVWWLLEKCWGHCGVSTTGLPCSRSPESNYTSQNLWLLQLLHVLQTGAVAFSDAHFGAGKGQIRKIVCSGGESRLMSCSSSICGRYESGYWGTRYFVNAVHTDDAGVRCQGIFAWLHTCLYI